MGLEGAGGRFNRVASCSSRQDSVDSAVVVNGGVNADLTEQDLMRSLSLATITLACCLAVGDRCSALTPPLTLRTVALSGQAAPGAGIGATFGGSFPFSENPVINADGRVAFRANLAGPSIVPGVNNAGLFSEGAGALSLVAQTSSSGFNALFDPLIDEDGRSYFRMSRIGPDGNSLFGLWSDATGAPAPIVERFYPAPGSGGQHFHDIFAPRVIGDGQISFFSTLSNGLEQGIWTNFGGPIQLVARHNGPVFGMGSDARFGPMLPIKATNDSGESAFRSWVFGPGNVPIKESAVWVGTPTSRRCAVWRAGSRRLARRQVRLHRTGPH
jgi:hypothetical protein